ncbi:hypothetical protein [Enterococcus gilvus]|uniref:hypothetical protein n=1 Tax=Enterococcus gilvus TaxID=160453 RepID=UPI001C8B3B96|nr:hypothetical protein [Enterococcus gilvus]MBX8935947.1 hypothetical protein [Enterococcus gilvus]
MKTISSLIKHNLIKQTRSYSFLLVMMVSVFLAFLCVPALGDGYEIFYLGGVRGIYNAYWLGAIAAMLPVILLWLPGFYLLRSQISEDRRLNIGQVIAAAPVSKGSYIFGKFIANFSVLFVADLLFTVAMLIMQLIRHEDLSIQLGAYLMPLLVIAVPYLIFLAALTVLFDVVPGIKNAFGNCLIFIVWIGLATVSVAAPGNAFDLFGLGYLLNQMSAGARSIYPALPEGGSFGYYPQKTDIPTFEWQGVQFDSAFLISRLLWILAALGLILISILVFNRFKEKSASKSKKLPQQKTSNPTNSLKLSPIKKTRFLNLFLMVKGELKIMLMGQKTWWYLFLLTSICLSGFIVIGSGLKWGTLILLLPMGILSQMGCREKQFNLTQLIKVSCPWQLKWLATFIAGLLIAFFTSSGILIRFTLAGAADRFITWSVGLLFITALAMALGTLTGNRKPFEGLYIALLYFGPINNLGTMDFMGVQTMNTLQFLIVAIVLTAISFSVTFIKENQLKKGVLKNEK